MAAALLVEGAGADTVGTVHRRPLRPWGLIGPLRTLRQPRRALLAVIIVALLAVIVTGSLRDSTSPGTKVPAPTVTLLGDIDNPADYMAPHWVEILDAHHSGEDEDGAHSPEDVDHGDIDLAELSDPNRSDLGAEAAAGAVSVAEDVLRAYLTGKGQDRWGDHFNDPFAEENPDADVAGTCDTVSIAAGAAAALPGVDGEETDNAKVLFLWTGECPALALAAHAAGTEELPQRMSFVYLTGHDTTWAPVRVSELPGSAAGYILSSGGGLSDWQRAPFGPCGTTADHDLTALGEVVAAWAAMCEAARADGVELTITSAYRDPATQAELFEEAVEERGSEEEARRYVASSDGVDCSSRHCAGTAIDIRGGEAALRWLGAPVGCWDPGAGRLLEGGAPCPKGSEAVERAQMYGFARTLAHQRAHLDYVLVTESAAVGGATADCTPPRSLKVPQIVARVWRCQLGAAGLSAEEVRLRVAEAVVVSRCASAWNADAVEEGGRFLEEPHPVTGKTYDGLGVFQLTRSQAETFNVTWEDLVDPVANAALAAKIYLAGSDGDASAADGWASWDCATGTDDKAPALEHFGGPPLPEWAFDY